MTVAFIDGTQLTHWRTSSISPLAATYLARQDAGVLAVVGAACPLFGKGSPSSETHFVEGGNLEPQASKAKSLARKLRGELGFLEVECGVNLDEIVDMADGKYINQSKINTARSAHCPQEYVENICKFGTPYSALHLFLHLL